MAQPRRAGGDDGGAYAAALARGLAARDSGTPEAAEAAFRAALRARPGDPAAACHMGTTLLAQQRPERAIPVLEAALRTSPGASELHMNLGLALRALGRHDPSAEHFRAATRLAPGLATAWSNLGNAMRSLGRLPEAEAAHDRAFRLRPDLPGVQYNFAMLLLAQGRYEPGFRAWEARIPVLGLPPYPGAQWRGEPIPPGETLLIHAEQGFGDSIQFCRFVPQVAARGRVALFVPTPLRRLLGGLGAEDVFDEAEGARFDWQIPMMSLPRVLGTTLETLPAAVPYLQADPARVAAWAARLEPLPAPRIGLAWAGNPAFADFRQKSVPAAKMERLLTVPGASFVSLQKGTEGGALRSPRGVALHDWTAELTDFAETAALVAGLDLVVCIDTAVAHLAGALGRPVWMLDRADTCWRWLHGREDSPWYPTLRIWRQPRPGDWDAVLARVLPALRSWVDGARAG